MFFALVPWDPALAETVGILTPGDATPVETLAAKEVRRYVYLRTGRLLPLVAGSGSPRDQAWIVVANKNRPLVERFLSGPELRAMVAALGPQQYLLRRVDHNDHGAILVVGGDRIGTLYAAYRLAEQWGVRFYLHGDVVPERRTRLQLPEVDEVGKPLFDCRGILPFHDFPEGPDWWNVDDYKAIISQLPKLRMNFIGLHNYPESDPEPTYYSAEPGVWIGLPQDIGEKGRVHFAYPSRYFTTVNGEWDYLPTKTSDFFFGAAALFDRDAYGSDVMRDMSPWPPNAKACNELFRRTGLVLGEAFCYARLLGVKTCIGMESPMTIPRAVRARLQSLGKSPEDPAVVQELYEGVFRRIGKTYPLDYYWLWTPESWTMQGATQRDVEATLADFDAATAAAARAKASFTLATCGWVLGPPQDRALFDRVLSKDMPVSCINRSLGRAPVEPGFAQVRGRPQWVIPWLEDDMAMVSPQLWVGRIRRDAADAHQYGCTGLMGIHWRTRVLGPNVAALALAAWDQRAWNPEVGRKPAPAEKRLQEGPVGGQTAVYPNNPIVDTQDDRLYQAIRLGMKGYVLNVPRGTYRVTLKFCEPVHTTRGKRAFGVKLQGKRVIERLDLFAEAGQNKAVDYTFEDIEIADGRMAIDFVPLVGEPCVSAIVIDGRSADERTTPAKPCTRKINCGGADYKDYQASWSFAGSKPRHLPAADFYADWARAEFGPEVAKPAAELFARLDCRLPSPSTWVGAGPGGIEPDERPWEQVRSEYDFVGQLAALRAQVRGTGNLARFDYWLNNFRYMRCNAAVNCKWAQLNAAMKRVRAEKRRGSQERLARQIVLPLRKELVSLVAQMHQHLLATVSTNGAMGTLANWRQHTMPSVLIDPGRELAQILGEDLPPDAMPSTRYTGASRIIVPTVRTSLLAGESLKLKVILLGVAPRDATIRWRPLGPGPFAHAPLRHIARGVYAARLPAGACREDVEYHIHVVTDHDETLLYPSTAPEMNQTVVVFDEHREAAEEVRGVGFQPAEHVVRANVEIEDVQIRQAGSLPYGCRDRR